MPQTGDGDDIERSGRGKLRALEELRQDLADELGLPARDRDSEEITKIRADIAAAERLLEAEQAEDTAEAATEAAEEPVRTLSRGQKISIGARTNNWARREIGTANYAEMSSSDKQKYTKFRNRLTNEALAN